MKQNVGHQSGLMLNSGAVYPYETTEMIRWLHAKSHQSTELLMNDTH